MREGKENPFFVNSLAGETKKGSDGTAALPDRISRYSRAHHRALDMSDYIRNHADNNEKVSLSEQLKSCGTYLQFRNYFQVGKVLLSAMISCKKHLLCPLCAMRRGAKFLKSYLERLEVIQKENPGLKAYLVTLTVKNGADLLERYDHLQNSIQAYTQQRRNGLKGQKKVEFNKAFGAVGSYEFKRGSGSGLWHPHFHAVWLCYEVPDQGQLSREWHAITEDSFIVHVEPFYDQDDVVSGFMEVFKYALKFSDMPLDQNWEGFETLQRKRLVTSFGVFRNVEVPESNLDDLLEDEPYIELFFSFIRGDGYHLVKESEIINPVQNFIDQSFSVPEGKSASIKEDDIPF